MDDTLKNVLFGFLGLMVFHASLEKRASHDATREVQEAFQHTGVVRTRVEARGLFGVYTNRLYSIDVQANDMRSDHLPFTVIPRSGWKGSIRHLRLHFHNLSLKGLVVDQFDADVPNVTYDIGRALYKDRLVIRGAGEGPAYVRIAPASLRDFIGKKYKGTISDASVSFDGHRVAISGHLLFFGASSPFAASGELEPRAGRFLDLVKPIVELNGKPLTEAATVSLLKQINPVLDIASDVDLSKFFTISRVEIGDDYVTVFGRASVPISSSGNLPQ